MIYGTQDGISANTDDLDTKRKDHKCETVYSTSGGISPIANAYINNLEEGGRLVSYDVESYCRTYAMVTSA